MITAVDLLRGIAALVGWPRIEVEGATGYLDTNYAGKGQAAIDALEEYDVVCVHIEAPDEASHEGRHEAKIEALEQIDRHIVGPLVEAAARHGDHRILVSPDHPTPCSTKKHSHGMVPLVIAGTGIEADSQTTYDEVAAEASQRRFDKGWDLMDFFVGR
jgi:2,3-bisphosphoglycerate-independent phosphoglycerate mutase